MSHAWIVAAVVSSHGVFAFPLLGMRPLGLLSACAAVLFLTFARSRHMIDHGA